MYRSLFQLAGFAILGWVLLIFLPTWRVTRRIADSALIPAYIALLYVVGVWAVFRELGPGIMADFGTADGVLGLLRMEGVALVAWIHILAFDQVVAHLIYRDNMKHRYVPIPVQSILLFMTLMLGPLGFLSYWLIRVVRSRGLVAWGDRAELPVDPEERPVRFSDVVKERSVVPAVLGLLRRERGLVLVAAAGFVLAAIGGAIALIHGDWLLEPEGRLPEAVRFDAAFGIFILTLALLLPLSAMSSAAKRRWRGWTIGLTIFAWAMENIQTWRGLDPRFTRAGSVLDQILGGVFFMQAIGVLILFVVLTASFFRDDALPDHPTLRIALRYGALAANLAFFVGILMSGLSGRFINGQGNLMAIHAGGFHGLQAIPLIALLLGWSRLSEKTASRSIHIAGMGWLVLCAGLLVQALTGIPLFSPGPGTALMLVGLGVWLLVLLYALWSRRSVPGMVAASLLATCALAVELPAQDTVVVRANARPVWGAVTVTRELRIGEVEGREQYMFGRISGIAVRPTGEILVLDAQAKTIREFDAAGKFVRSMGRNGSGPGELLQPEALALARNGNLLVRDPRNARIAVYDRSGNSVAHWPFRTNSYTNAPLFVDTAGHVLSQLPIAPGNLSSFVYHRYRPDGTVRDTIPWPSWGGFKRRDITISQNNATSTYLIPYEPDLIRTYSPHGYFVGGVNNRYAIDLVRDGRVTRITREWTPLRIGADERSALRDRLLSNIRRNQNVDRSVEIAETKPAFSSLVVDDEGRIWVTVQGASVQRPGADPGQPPVWSSELQYDILTPAGQYLATVRFPERFQPRVMRGDLVWGIERDQFDVSYVSRYRMVHGR